MNLELAGVLRSTAMDFVGHKTESIYRRHAIPNVVALRQGAEKLAALSLAGRQRDGRTTTAPTWTVAAWISRTSAIPGSPD